MKGAELVSQGTQSMMIRDRALEAEHGLPGATADRLGKLTALEQEERLFARIGGRLVNVGASGALQVLRDKGTVFVARVLRRELTESENIGQRNKGKEFFRLGPNGQRVLKDYDASSWNNRGSDERLTAAMSPVTRLSDLDVVSLGQIGLAAAQLGEDGVVARRVFGESKEKYEGFTNEGILRPVHTSWSGERNQRVRLDVVV